MATQSQTTIPDFNTPIPLSDTVKTTIAAFPDATPVTAWMLARGAMTFHDEYGNYLAKRLVSESGPAGGTVKPATTWLDETIALFDPAQVHEIHGRLFILGLAELDPELARYLDNFGFRDALKKELLSQYGLSFESLIRIDIRSNLNISASVANTINKFRRKAPVSAIKLVQEILSQNPHITEYGYALKENFFNEQNSETGDKKSANDWLQEIVNLYDSQRVKWLNSELFVLGLLELDKTLKNYLDINTERLHESMYLKVSQELGVSYKQILRSTSHPHSPSDQITFRDDAATDADQLGRAGFADALATWLNRIWRENYTSYVSQLEKAYQNETPLPQSSSFIVHLHGPWGSGKTSLLRLMEKALQNIELNIGGKPQRWTIAWFNAWRNRQIDPVWWPPMDRVYRELVQSPSTNLGFWAWETWWRLGVNGLGENPLVLGLGLVALAGLFFWLTGSASSDGSWLASLQSIGGIVGLASTLGAGILTLSRSLFTASSAQSFARLAQDPMEKVRTHFREMMDRTNHPVMVFIDDLDRCQPEYVVRLLESIQTLFNDPRVFYVIAADRRWLYECFEIVYKDFKGTVREPGRRTGYLFLEKIFQMSISVPAMSKETQKAYLDYLYRGVFSVEQEEIEEASREAEDAFAETGTIEELIKQLDSRGDEDPLVQQIRREAAVRRLASQEVSSDIEHFLQPFASLLERNPRAMKRLVNAYSVYLALAMLADIQLINSQDKKKRFALWTILSLRWPALAEKLEDDPESLPALLEKKADGLDPDLAALVQDDEVQRLLHGEAKGVGVALDVDTIERLWGLQANTSTPVVA